MFDPRIEEAVRKNWKSLVAERKRRANDAPTNVALKLKRKPVVDDQVDELDSDTPPPRLEPSPKKRRADPPVAAKRGRDDVAGPSATQRNAPPPPLPSTQGPSKPSNSKGSVRKVAEIYNDSDATEEDEDEITPAKPAKVTWFTSLTSLNANSSIIEICSVRPSTPKVI